MLQTARAAIFVIGCWFAAGAAPALAQAPSDLLAKVTLEDVRDALQEIGFRARITEDAQGSYVASASSGQNFFVSLLSCDDQKLCKTLSMESGAWTPKTPLTIDSLNKFHGDNYGWVAAVPTSDGKYMAITRTGLSGGVTRQWLQDTLYAFTASMDSFVAFMKQ